MTRYNLTVIKGFLVNLFNCSKLLENPFQAYGYLRSGKTPNIASFKISRLPFVARKEDWLAIREVLVDDEYSCVDLILSNADKPLIFDIGANIGTFALRVFSQFPQANVVSVEAAKDTYQVLRRNRDLNTEFSWDIYNKGVWGKDCQVSLLRRGTSMGHRVVGGGEEDEVIDGVTLQTLFGNYGRDIIDLLKIDIEGGEENVIPSSLNILGKVRYLIIEIHSDRIDASKILPQLKSLFSFHWRLNDRMSSKPLYLMTNESIDTENTLWTM